MSTSTYPNLKSWVHTSSSNTEFGMQLHVVFDSVHRLIILNNECFIARSISNDPNMSIRKPIHFASAVVSIDLHYVVSIQSMIKVHLNPVKSIDMPDNLHFPLKICAYERACMQTTCVPTLRTSIKLNWQINQWLWEECLHFHIWIWAGSEKWNSNCVWNEMISEFALKI